MPEPTPLSSRIRSDAIAVYVYRRTDSADIEFLQLLRAPEPVESQEYVFQQLSWQIVYGGIEKNETAIAAALRELREETALFPEKLFQVEYLEMFYFQHKDYVTVMPVFAAEVSPAATLTLNDEHTARRWIPASEVSTHFMWRSQREAIALILEALRATGISAEAHRLLTVDLAKYKSPGTKITKHAKSRITKPKAK